MKEDNISNISYYILDNVIIFLLEIKLQDMRVNFSFLNSNTALF